MKKFKKFALISISLFLSSSLFAHPYTNLIIFGDSQSDIGNMPESSNISGKDSGIPYNVYVPFSNPIISDQDKKWSDFFKASDLPPQPTIDGNSRAGRSLNWTQYLFFNLKAENELESDALMPWVSLYKHHSSVQSLSVNYSFAGALSNDHCANEAYTPMPEALCTATTIFETQNKYRQHPEDNALRHAVVIPGVQKQIDLFGEDLKAGRVKADEQTLYIVWTGANDVTQSFLAVLNEGSLKDFYRALTRDLPDLIAGDQNSAVLRLYGIGARKIMIISQQNLGLAPEASQLMRTDKHFMGRYMTASFLNILMLRYNLALSERIAHLQKEYPDLQIHNVNIQTKLNRLSLIPSQVFFQTLGRACQNKNAATYTALIHGDLIDCNDYLYWNNAHLSNEGNRVVAEAVKAALA